MFDVPSGASASLTLRPGRIPSMIPGVLTAAGLCFALYSFAVTPDTEAPAIAKSCTVMRLAVSLFYTFFVAPRNFTVGYLGGLFALLAGWRIPGHLGVGFVAWPLLLAFAAFVIQFADVVHTDWQRKPAPLLSCSEWQLTFLRIYVGFDLVPHFTEKLFAGPVPFSADVAAFASFGLPMPGAFVVLGGLYELGIAVGLGMGFLTRFAVVGGTLYFVIATVLGGHFGNGFIWASPNGGWEYPVLMMAVIMSFALPGAGKFSVDRVLRDKGMWPAHLRVLASG